jgi:hypothetical protein
MADRTEAVPDSSPLGASRPGSAVLNDTSRSHLPHSAPRFADKERGEAVIQRLTRVPVQADASPTPRVAFTPRDVRPPRDSGLYRGNPPSGLGHTGDHSLPAPEVREKLRRVRKRSAGG